MDHPPHSSADMIARGFLEARRRGERLSIDAVLDSCGPLPDRPGTRAEVLALLAKRAPPSSAGGAPQDPAGLDAFCPPLDDYAIIARIGCGGMGTVYEGYQLATGRRVAVKFLSDATGNPSARQRFEREVELAARLDHPHIVAIIDSGVHRGRYFYAMEYVEGRPLDRALPSPVVQRGDIETVLQLVVTISEAVDYAHQRGVLHRDLKPSNILIDSTGRPRLLDFGLAKAIDPESRRTADITLSEPGQLIGTLGYMAPEQARGEWRAVSVRSDVYALGAIAYRLLAGRLPIAVDGPLQTALQRIESQDPQRPSSINRRLGADIDAILLKALSKSVEQRYRSAAALADDVRRTLRDQPIMARPPSPALRFAKLIRRHRVLAGSVAAIAVVLAGAIAAVGRSALRESRQRTLAEKHFDQVRNLAHRFMFDVHDEIARLPGSTAARRLLVTTALEYLDALSGDAGENAELQNELATAYIKVGDVQGNPNIGGHLGDMAGALVSYRKALQIWEGMAANQRGPKDLPTALFKVHSRIGDVLWPMGRTQEAVQSYEESLRFAGALQAATPPDVDGMVDACQTHSKIADLRRAQGMTDIALAEYERGLDCLQPVAAGHPDHVRAQVGLSTAHHQIATMLANTGRLEDGLARHRVALAILEHVVARDRSQTWLRRSLTCSFEHLSLILEKMGRLDEAIDYRRRELEIVEQLAGEDTPNALAQQDLSHSCRMTGELLETHGDLEEAEHLLRRSIAIARALAEQDPANTGVKRELALSQRALGGVLRTGGRYDEALALLEMALGIQAVLAAEGANDDTRRELSLIHEGLGELHRFAGRLQQALDHYQVSLGISRELFAADPANTEKRRDRAVAEDQVGDVLLELHRHAEARASFLQFNKMAAELLELDPANVVVLRDVAVSHYKLALAASAMAGDETAPRDRQVELWREAEAGYQRSHVIFADLARRGALRPAEAHAPAELLEAANKCQASIAALLGRTEANALEGAWEAGAP